VIKKYPNRKIFEKLASIEHDRWSEWQCWCHTILRKECPSKELERVLVRWDRQIATPYVKLSKREKDKDRDQVMRYWNLINRK